MRVWHGVVVAVLTTGCASGGAVHEDAPRIDPRIWAQLLEAEDVRAASSQHLDVLRGALTSENAFVRSTAGRALGRTERADLAGLIAPLLRDGAEAVRATAAHALGDVTRDTASAAARRWLLEALPAPGAADNATAAIVETLGRLRHDANAARDVAQRIAAFLEYPGEARLGAARGLYFLARQPAGRAAVGAVAAAPLRSVIDSASAGARERGIALATLALAGAADERTLTRAAAAAEPQVRRQVAAAAAALEDTAAVRRILTPALNDAVGAVRYEALRVFAGRLAAVRGCDRIRAATRDADAHVSLLAIDLLGTACRSAEHAALLDSTAAARRGERAWHHAAHATVALAAVDPARARPRVRALARHANDFARAYAARAAGPAADTAQLYDLARDRSANVRTAAVAALSTLVGRAADSVYIAQLTSDESELLQTAAAALEGSRRSDVAAAELLAALDRVSALKHETSRDGRVALLERVEELGSASLAERVRPYLRDFDPAVATRAAAVLETWTGSRPAISPAPLPRLALPTFAEALRLTERVFVLDMEGGGQIGIRLLPFVAPTNAARFARLARSGYFDGLTFHRVVPNFVVQGGSPGANEYSGDGPFTRDELAAANWRGTVGLSTRGRDTGDAQIFINLVDNVRLDHEYTVFGVVMHGMDEVDGLMEGAVILRVRERTARSPQSSARPM